MTEETGNSLPEPTERFQRVLAFATDEADGLGHGFVTCQHILYALSRESKGLASAVLDRLGVTPQHLHAFLAESAAPHDRLEGRIDLAVEVRQAVERAVDAARTWGHRVLDTEHLLFGILSATTSADDMLSAMQVDAASVLAQLADMREKAPPAIVRDEATHSYRFTLETAWLLSMAMDLAREYGSAYVGSLHLLAALASVESPAREVLVDTLGVRLEQLARHIRRASAAVQTRGRLPLNEDVQRILGYSIGEAWNRGHQAVTPLHLAMGLARAERQEALDVLADLGVPQADLIDAVSMVMPPSTTR